MDREDGRVDPERIRAPALLCTVLAIQREENTPKYSYLTGLEIDLLLTPSKQQPDKLLQLNSDGAFHFGEWGVFSIDIP